MANSLNVNQQDFPFMFFSNVNRRVNPYDMKDDELYDNNNWWTERTIGAKKVRPGYNTFLDKPDAGPVKGLFWAKFGDGTKRLIMCSAKNIYAVDPTTASSWGSAKLSPISGTSWVRPDFTVLSAVNGSLPLTISYLVHIVDKITSTEFHYVTGTNDDSYTDQSYSGSPDVIVPFKSATCQQYHRRVYVADSYDGTNEYTSILGFSTLNYQNKSVSGTATPWTTQTTLTDPTYAGYNFVDPDYDGKIIKLTNIRDRLMVYKESGVYFYNDSTGGSTNIFGLSSYVGSIATSEDEKMDYFFTNEGFFRTDGQGALPIGEGWYNIIKDIIANGITTSKICSHATNFLYFCYLDSVTYDGKTLNHAMFVYNAYYDELSLWNLGHQITAIGHYVDVNGEKQIIFGDVNGNTYNLSYLANNDAGISIHARFRTKYWIFDSPNHRNNLFQVDAFINPGSQLDINVDKDYENQYTDGLINAKKPFTSDKIDNNKLGQFNVLSAEVSWNGDGKRPEIYGIIPKILDVGDRLRGLRGK